MSSYRLVSNSFMPRMRCAHVRWSEAPAARGSVKAKTNGLE